MHYSMRARVRLRVSVLALVFVFVLALAPVSLLMLVLVLAHVIVESRSCFGSRGRGAQYEALDRAQFPAPLQHPSPRCHLCIRFTGTAVASST
jgi:hypothetical protein